MEATFPVPASILPKIRIHNNVSDHLNICMHISKSIFPLQPINLDLLIVSCANLGLGLALTLTLTNPPHPGLPTSLYLLSIWSTINNIVYIHLDGQ